MRVPSTTPSFPDAARHALALSLVDGVGPKKYHELLATFGSAARALDDAQGGPRAAALLDQADAFLERAARCGMAVLVHGDEGYPSQLDSVRDPPPVLWALGRLELLETPLVGIVGTRVPTAYGERIARQLGEALARAGATIVSGMALGIDGIAHRAALAVGDATVAVLGTGADIAYPRPHRALHRTIVERGLVLSELPPGTRGAAGAFPRRNRVIAALSRVTIVVEAGYRSGALITADHALDLGRSLAGVPGPIDSPQSAGVNQMLRDGAQVIVTIDDALGLAGLSPPEAPAPPDDPSEAAIWRALEAGALEMDALVAVTGLDARAILVALTALELRGMVEFRADGSVGRR